MRVREVGRVRRAQQVTMPTKNVTDERISKFKNKGKDPAVSRRGLFFTRDYSLIKSASWPFAETQGEKDLGDRGAA